MISMTIRFMDDLRMTCGVAKPRWNHNASTEKQHLSFLFFLSTLLASQHMSTREQYLLCPLLRR
uniref:Uncharacterized protein n=1 Tax=Arundo donax TaxID=35708 RepID=A0A0A8Z0X3_ARUDO